MKKKSPSDNIILNEKEDALLLDHNYDGIEEFDYPLPSWWVITFVGGIIFAFLYIFYYEAGGALSLQEEYEKKLSKVMEIRAEEAKKLGNFSTDHYTSWVANNDSLKIGLNIYNENCLSCHEEKGKGDIGPNLTDKYWLNITKIDPKDIFNFIVKGNEDNGMPAWGEIITKEEIYAVTAYILSLKNTHAIGGKEPQGKVLE